MASRPRQSRSCCSPALGRCGSRGRARSVAASMWLVMRQPDERDVAVAHGQVRQKAHRPVCCTSRTWRSPTTRALLFIPGALTKDTSLFVHRFDDGTVQPVRGTSGARWPFLSPDGKWVGFFRAGRIQKVSLAGGDALTLCEANGGPGAVWLPDGRIIFGGIVALGSVQRLGRRGQTDAADDARCVERRERAPVAGAVTGRTAALHRVHGRSGAQRQSGRGIRWRHRDDTSRCLPASRHRGSPPGTCSSSTARGAIKLSRSI